MTYYRVLNWKEFQICKSIGEIFWKTNKHIGLNKSTDGTFSGKTNTCIELNKSIGGSFSAKPLPCWLSQFLYMRKVKFEFKTISVHSAIPSTYLHMQKYDSLSKNVKNYVFIYLDNSLFYKLYFLFLIKKCKELRVKVGFFQKVMAKFSNLSYCHSCEPKIVCELLFPVHVIIKVLVIFWIYLAK